MRVWREKEVVRVWSSIDVRTHESGVPLETNMSLEIMCINMCSLILMELLNS